MQMILYVMIGQTQMLLKFYPGILMHYKNRSYKRWAWKRSIFNQIPMLEEAK